MFKMFFKKTGDIKGFTLVELMTVVAIVGILAVIAIPRFGAYRQKTYDTSAHSDLKNFQTGLEAYHAEHDQFPY